MAEQLSDKQRQFAIEVVQTLRECGFEAFWAGGCVRDKLLNRDPKDYDVATNARPEQIRQVFGRRRTLAIGAAFGVITVLGTKEAGQIEVTTFRQDATYSDGRHPDHISFSTPEEDAKRRDFTINGLFYDPLDDRLIDFVGGVEDLKRGLIRAIGDPRQRFAEDKLRMLRAVRFAATFGFALDEATLAAAREMAPEINVVSAERIAGEMRNMLEHPRRADALRLLLKADLVSPTFPELLPLIERASDWELVLRIVESLDRPSLAVVLAAILFQFDDPRKAKEVARRWRLSRHDEQLAFWLLQNLRFVSAASAMNWPQLQRLLISPEFADLLKLYDAMARTGAAPAEPLKYCREKLSLPADELDPPPLVTGDDLIAHGVPRGKSYKRLLDAVRDAQLNREIHTLEQALALVDQLRGK